MSRNGEKGSECFCSVYLFDCLFHCFELLVYSLFINLLDWFLSTL